MGLPFKIKKALFPRTRVINRTITQTSESSGLELGETDATAYRGDRGKTAYDYSQVGHIPSSYLDTDATMAANSDSKVATQKSGKAYSDAKVADAINNGTTTVAPSQNAVYDALALKLNTANPSITGNLQLGEDGGLILDKTLSADGKFSIAKGRLGTLGETISAIGTLLYYKASDSRWWRTDSDVAATSVDVPLALACATGNAGEDVILMEEGVMRSDALFPTLTIGAPVYIGSSTGAIQVSKPSSGFIRVVGYGDTADALIFKPSNDWSELGTFSPTALFAGGATGLTYSDQYGYFRKSKDVVHIVSFLGLANKGSSTGIFTLASLPYTSKNATNNVPACSLVCYNFNAIGVPMAQQNPNTTVCYFTQLSTAGANSEITDATCTNSTAVRLAVTYFV